LFLSLSFFSERPHSLSSILLMNPPYRRAAYSTHLQLFVNCFFIIYE
jgi:hypothetical protein